MKGVD